MSLLNDNALCLPVSSADNLGKQFGPRSGPTIHRARSGSKLFDILIVFLKEFFWKINFEKNQQTTKKHEKLPSMQWVKLLNDLSWIEPVGQNHWSKGLTIILVQFVSSSSVILRQTHLFLTTKNYQIYRLIARLIHSISQRSDEQTNPSIDGLD